MITVSPTAKVRVTATPPHFIRRSLTDGRAVKHPSDGSVSQPVVQRTLAPMVLPRQKENEAKLVTNKCKWKALFVMTVMSRWRRSNENDSWSNKSPSQIWAASARRPQHDVLCPAEAHPRICFSSAAGVPSSDTTLGRRPPESERNPPTLPHPAPLPPVPGQLIG